MILSESPTIHKTYISIKARKSQQLIIFESTIWNKVDFKWILNIFSTDLNFSAFQSKIQNVIKIQETFIIQNFFQIL